MTKRQQPRRWVFVSVAIAFLLGLLIYQLDHNKLYHTLQTQMAHIGIQLQSQDIQLSFMYFGSIQLDDVTIHTDTFDLTAQHLFIDLNLAALLTGTALPQALYLQRANINIHDNKEHKWLTFIDMPSFKLNRIDISQSKIHFEEQHMTLKQVNLDIRDIGRNKNPRGELRAHIGEGRLDAHGFLHLKRGAITQGFGRLKIYDVPLNFLQHGTSLETLNGSITSHLNQDETWQSFGHISLQAKQQDELELRGKVTGHNAQLFNIKDMILSIKNVGTVQIAGGCAQRNNCQIQLNSKEIKINALLGLFHKQVTKQSDNRLQNIHITSTWKNKIWTNHGNFSWSALDYLILRDQKEDIIHIDATKVQFSGLQRDSYANWQLQNAKILQNEQLTVSVQKAHYQGQHWQLPLQFFDTKLWLPFAQLAEYTWENNTSLTGKGRVTGKLEAKGTNTKLDRIIFEFDAYAAELRWQELFKPLNTSFLSNGSLQREHAEISLQLADSYATLSYFPNTWQLHDFNINLDNIKEQGITLPSKIQAWHGRMHGNLNMGKQNFRYANLIFSNFGMEKHAFTGDLNLKNNRWDIEKLVWNSEKNKTHISTTNGQFNIVADTLDLSGLVLLQKLPPPIHGHISSKSLSLPVGILKNMSAAFDTNKERVVLHQMKAGLFEGSLHAKKVAIIPKKQSTQINGQIQLGGVRLTHWHWLQKQFQSHLEGNLYATLNLKADFTPSTTLSKWQGDGDVMVYNSVWLLNQKKINADKFSLSFHKRDQLRSNFKIKHGKEKGKGNIIIDPEKNVSGHFTWKNTNYQLSKSWPHIQTQTKTPAQ